LVVAGRSYLVDAPGGLLPDTQLLPARKPLRPGL